MIMGSISSALVDEVTSILFMTGTMLHLTSKYKLKPAPFIIMLVFATNIGSSASSIGNPIGVMIALKTGLGFMEFLKWSMPVALVVDLVTFAICRWYFATEINEFAEAVKGEHAAKLKRRTVSKPALAAVSAGTAGNGESSSIESPAIDDATAEDVLDSTFFNEGPSNAIDGLDVKSTYRLCWALFLGLITLLVTHRLTERLFGLKEGTMMIGAALLMASIVLMIRRDKARDLLERRVDWWTLSFFMMLFASVGTLQDTHVTQVIASKLSAIGGGEMTTTQIIGWSTGWLSAFLDNVLAVATFMPVVHDIRVQHRAPYSSMIYWFMLFGGTFMGNMTIIGSTANIVAVGLLEKRGHGSIGFGYWMKIGFIVSIASMIVATVLLVAMSHLPEGHRIPMLDMPQPEHVST